MSEIKVNSVVNSTGDNDSGLDLATNDQVIIKTANTTAITVDSSQNATIAGDIRKTTAGTSNFCAGVNAGNSILSGGNHNTVVGDEAGTAITTGIENTLVGSGAGDALTDADFNVAIGTDALTADTKGSRSVAIGRRTLHAQNFTSATDAYNVAIGFEAGNDITTAVQNTLIGGKAGDAVTVGADNVAVGYEALTGETGGQNNTAIGVRALKVQQNSSGNTRNTAVGSNAGVAISTGSQNTLIGARSAENGTTANDNVFVGYASSLSAVDTAQVIVLGNAVTSQSANNFTFGFGATDSNIAFGATSISAPSDERYKENIETSTAGLGFINDLRPVTFRWKKEKDIPTDHKAYVKDSEKRVMEKGDKIQHGFIAQEVKTAIDNHSELKNGFSMWTADPTDGRQRLSPSELIPILTKALQELSAKIETLEAKVTALESK